MCLHESTKENTVTLRNCDDDVTPGTEIYVFREAAVCSCSLCKSSEASCQGLRYRGARRAPRDVGGLTHNEQTSRPKRNAGLQFEEGDRENQVNPRQLTGYSFLGGSLPIGAFGPGVISYNVESSDGLPGGDRNPGLDFQKFLRFANRSEPAVRPYSATDERIPAEFEGFDGAPRLEKYKIITEKFGKPAILSVKRFGVDFPSNMMNFGFI